MKEKNYQWYILSVRGGREAKFIEKIKSELAKKGWSDCIREFKVVNDSNQKNILKGYILCHSDLNSELVRFFYKVPEVIGFLNHQRGDDKLPDPVSERVVKDFLTRMKGKKEIKVEKKGEVDLKLGDLVKVEITAGTFREGRITSIDNKKQKVKIVIESSGWEINDVPVNNCQKILN